MRFRLDIQYFGGRGSSSSIPTATPGGGGEPGGNWSQFPNTQQPDTLREALGKKGKAGSMADATLNSNPYYDGSYREFSENCQRAVIAYEARRRGYNVTAQPTFEGDNLPNVAYVNSKTGVRNSFWMGAFKGAKPEAVGKTTAKATQNALENKMKEYGNGSRAIMQVQWKGGGGHVINVEYKNGKVHYNDAQIGAKYKPSQLFSAIKTGATQITRTDNLQLSDRAKKSVEQANSRTGRR